MFYYYYITHFISTIYVTPTNSFSFQSSTDAIFAHFVLSASAFIGKAFVGAVIARSAGAPAFS